ncbi:YfiR family protein [Methylophaga sp. OBS1]|uniref:YfiR family protein n=1 Tax=Methylophaga sp. OBS1 TaxID=2991933 RepID=UPI00224D87F8|nr:YfiR family protein [Methylophaga sp. OBS1]MCX4190870.1 YfiR family protein [Methylophaga sp. OBS1]MCX4192183.1 YfiR family protein [Methylophaga sp. OBS1]
MADSRWSIEKVALLKLKTLFLLALLLSHGTQPVIAVAQQPDSRSVIAALNYNFAKYADWPDEEHAESIRLCYFTHTFKNSFTELHDKAIFNKPISTHQINDVEQTDQCHLVYIDRNERDITQRLFVYLADKPVLTVSDISGFIDDGGMIEIVREDNKFRFKVNMSRMELANLKMSSQVLKLAVEVK